jgi:hypothetical protein
VFVRGVVSEPQARRVSDAPPVNYLTVLVRAMVHMAHLLSSGKDFRTRAGQGLPCGVGEIDTATGH